MTIEEMGKQLLLWFKELALDTLKIWSYMYAVINVLAYHLGV